MHGFWTCVHGWVPRRRRTDGRTDGRCAERDAYDDHDHDHDHACGFDSGDDDTDRRSTTIIDDARCEDNGAKIDDFIQLWKTTTMRKDDDDDDDRVRIVERRDGGPERRPRNVLG